MEKDVDEAIKLLKSEKGWTFLHRKLTRADALAFVRVRTEMLQVGDLAINNPTLDMFLNALEHRISEFPELFEDADWNLVCEIIEIGLTYE